MDLIKLIFEYQYMNETQKKMFEFSEEGWNALKEAAKEN